MSKISELEIVLSELRTAATAINSVASSLEKMFSTDTPTNPKEETPIPTLEEVRAILADASRNGHTAEIRLLLNKYGASKLSEVDSANYTALLADVEDLKNAT